MNPVLLHIYGPFAIHWYGVLIALGAAIALWRIRAEFLSRKLMDDKLFSNFVFSALLAGFVGGKLLQLVEVWFSGESFAENFSLSNGFSILGSIIALALVLLWFAYKHHLKPLVITDICARWAPLVQAFGRVGCFLAGCCNGCPTTVSWAVCYTHPDSLAMPMHVAIHPVQLYSATMLLLIWAILQLVGRKDNNLSAGSLTLLYFALVFAERFVLDFWRADAISAQSGLTFMQWVAVVPLGSIMSVFVVWKVVKNFQSEFNKRKK